MRLSQITYLKGSIMESAVLEGCVPESKLEHGEKNKKENKREREKKKSI